MAADGSFSVRIHGRCRRSGFRQSLPPAEAGVEADLDRGAPMPCSASPRRATRGRKAPGPIGGTPSSPCAESAAMSGSPDRSTGVPRARVRARAGFGHLRSSRRVVVLARKSLPWRLPHGVPGACEPDSDGKPPIAARTRVVSGPHGSADGTSCSGFRPPSILATSGGGSS
jgi:hypothetical protein